VLIGTGKPALVLFMNEKQESLITPLNTELTGAHTGSSGASSLDDSGASFVVNGLAGWKLENTTDGSSTTVTSNTATRVVGTLTGGMMMIGMFSMRIL